jgi:predicted aldo/keto reductase-like oxidoreductase
MDDSLEQQKEAILNGLPKNLHGKFIQCTDKIQYNNYYKDKPNFDEAYSAAINESSCQACMKGPYKPQIEEFIKKLIHSKRK